MKSHASRTENRRLHPLGSLPSVSVRKRQSSEQIVPAGPLDRADFVTFHERPEQAAPAWATPPPSGPKQSFVPELAGPPAQARPHPYSPQRGQASAPQGPREGRRAAPQDIPPAPSAAAAGGFGCAGPRTALAHARQSSWALRLRSGSLADRLGFLRAPEDELVRGLAGRRAGGRTEDSELEAERLPTGGAAWPGPDDGRADPPPRGSCGPAGGGPGAQGSAPLPQRTAKMAWV